LLPIDVTSAWPCQADDVELNAGAGECLDDSARIEQLPVFRRFGVGEGQPQPLHAVSQSKPSMATTLGEASI
jgi:hypothetical protein